MTPIGVTDDSDRRERGRNRRFPAERPHMDSATSRWFARERWRQRAQRASDAFGLVFVLVLTTYVLASLLDNRGWTAVILTVATSATSVVALTSSHARPRFVRVAILLSALTIVPGRGRRAIRRTRSGSTSPRRSRSPCWRSRWLAVLRRVVTSAEVGSRTILGAISVYTVLGILFTFAYGDDRPDPGRRLLRRRCRTQRAATSSSSATRR